MNKKLQEIGKKLNITDKDIQRMQKGFISKKILVVVVVVAIAILAFIVWLLWRKETEPTPPSPEYPFSPPQPPTPTPLPTPSPSPMPTPRPHRGYPFYAPPGIIGGYLLTKNKNSRIAGFLISAIVFLSSLIEPPVFGQAIKYNVYKKRALKDFLVALIVIPIFGEATRYKVYSKR